MTSLIRKYCFKKKPKRKINERVYDKTDYDETCELAKYILKGVTIRMTHHISEKTTKWWDMFYWFELTNLCILIPSEIICMSKTIAEAQTFVDSVQVFGMMPCFGCVILAICKSIKMVTHRPVYENLVNELRDMWPEGELPEDEHILIKEPFKQLNIIMKGYFYVNNILVIFYMTPTIYFTIARLAGYDYPIGNMVFMYWLPFDVFRPVYFEVLLAVQTWHAVLVIWLNVAWDMTYCLFLCHIITQFDLLSGRIRRLFPVTVDKQLVSSYPMAAISEDMLRIEGERGSVDGHYWIEREKKEIAEIVHRHHALIRLTGDVENLCSFPMLINFMNSSIIICFCGFCCVLFEKWNDMAYKSFLTTALSQTFLLCWYGQKLIDASQRLADALYDCGWYNSNSKGGRSAMLIMLNRAQKGVYVTTFGFSVVSLASYSTIIKTAWSYFTLLLNFFKDKKID